MFINLLQSNNIKNVRNRLAISTLMVLIIFPLKSQDYEPTLKEGALWVVEIGQGMGSYTPYHTRLICDTFLINGKNYNSLEVWDPDNQECISLIGYVREDLEEKQVFFYHESYNDGEEEIVANYNLEVGDFHPLWNVTVDSIYYREFSGEQRKYFRFEGGYGGFYEGIGSTIYGVFPNCSGYKRLASYEIEEECQESVTHVWENTVNSTKIFPNPTNSSLIVKLSSFEYKDNLKIELINLTGETLVQKNVFDENTSLDLEQIPFGIYALLIKKNGILIATHKIIKN